MDEPIWVTAVLEFWFVQLNEAHWFTRSEVTDARIRDRFLTLHEDLFARNGAVPAVPRPLLAAVIVMDQFSRNLFRGTPRAFAADPIARRLSSNSIERGFDLAMSERERLFLYLPFEHSENRDDQTLAVELIGRMGNEEWTRDAIAHKTIIDRFGRYPYRNALLNRQSSPEEIAFLQEPTHSWY